MIGSPGAGKSTFARKLRDETICKKAERRNRNSAVLSGSAVASPGSDERGAGGV